MVAHTTPCKTNTYKGAKIFEIKEGGGPPTPTQGEKVMENPTIAGLKTTNKMSVALEDQPLPATIHPPTSPTVKKRRRCVEEDDFKESVMMKMKGERIDEHPKEWYSSEINKRDVKYEDEEYVCTPYVAKNDDDGGGGIMCPQLAKKVDGGTGCTPYG